MSAEESLEVTRQRRRRSDAEANVERILRAASELLRADPEASIEEIAAAAKVSRATVYRHFNSRVDVLAAARQQDRELSDANQQDTLRPPGELSGGPTPLDIADVLNKVPPHLLGEQIVAEAQRLAGVTSVAVYVVDIDGTQLHRLAGSGEFPDKLDAPLAVGPDIPREGLALLRASVEDELPGAIAVPMLLRGRAIGALLAVDAPEAALLDLGRQAAAAIALAASYTDVFDTARRRKKTSAASEIQQNLLPPRIARISGGMIAGNVLPGYDVGGDWFDYVENEDGAWIGVADAKGRGTTAAALGAVALGAFRAVRRVDGGLEETAASVHTTMQEVAIDGAFVNVILGRWNGPSATFSWIACGGQSPLLVTCDGQLVELAITDPQPLGIGPAKRRYDIKRRRLEPGERLLLVSDGVLNRKTHDDTPFGLDGVRQALAQVTDSAAASTVRALEDAITAASAELLEDDATIVVFAPTAPEQ